MIAMGLFGVNMGACACPDAARRIGTLAESLGYDSLWMGEHVVVPRPRVSPSPIEPDYPILDPLIALALMAASTTDIRLATGIVNLPQRNPVVLAKQLASLDVVSEGRLVFGLGVGYVHQEMRAVGVPMEGRGARADEYLAAMRALWMDDAPAFHGEHVEFGAVDAHPRPLQRPLPVVVGGHSPAALRRALREAEGWYGFLLDRAATAAHVEALRHEAAAIGRDLDGFSVVVTPSEKLDRDVVRDYERTGVDRLVACPGRAFWRRPELPLAEVEAFVRANAPERVMAAAA